MARKWTTVSITTALARQIDKLIEETGLWPSRSAFVQYAILMELQRQHDKPRSTSRGGENCPAPEREREVSTLSDGEGRRREPFRAGGQVSEAKRADFKVI